MDVVDRFFSFFIKITSLRPPLGSVPYYGRLFKLRVLFPLRAQVSGEMLIGIKVLPEGLANPESMGLPTTYKDNASGVHTNRK